MIAIKRRKEVWEAMREAERAEQDLAGSTGGATCTTGRNSDGTFGEGQEGFAASTAKATGKSKATVTRARAAELLNERSRRRDVSSETGRRRSHSKEARQ